MHRLISSLLQPPSGPTPVPSRPPSTPTPAPRPPLPPNPPRARQEPARAEQPTQSTPSPPAQAASIRIQKRNRKGHGAKQRQSRQRTKYTPRELTSRGGAAPCGGVKEPTRAGVASARPTDRPTSTTWGPVGVLGYCGSRNCFWGANLMGGGSAGWYGFGRARALLHLCAKPPLTCLALE